MNLYNQLLIDRYGERKIKKWISNSNKLNKIYENKKKYYECDGTINANYVIMGDAIDNTMAKYLLSTKKPKNQKEYDMLKSYWNKAYEEVKLEPARIFSNPVFNLPDEVLQPIFGQEGVQAIAKRQKVLSKRAKEIYKKYSNLEGVTLEQRKELIDFLNHTLELDDRIGKASRNVVNDIVNLEDRASMKEKSFVYKFLASEYCKKEGVHANVYLSDYEIGTKKKLIKSQAIGEQDKDIIVISKFVVEKTSFSELDNNMRLEDLKESNRKKDEYSFIISVQNLYHELTHVKQYDQSKKGYVNLQSMEMSKQLINNKYRKGKSYKDYMKNYKYSEIEIDANIEAWKETQSFVERYMPDKINHVKSNLNKKQMLAQLTDSSAVKYVGRNKEKLLPEKADVELMNDIMSKKAKKVFLEYPQMKVLYEKDGKLKTFEKLLFERERNINEKNDSNNRYENVYYDYINYNIDNDSLLFLDPYNKTDKELKMMSSSLADTMLEQLQQNINLHKNTHYIKSARENYEFLTSARIERINKIYNFFSKNKEIFSHYDFKKIQNYKDTSETLEKIIQEQILNKRMEGNDNYGKRMA